MPSLHKNAVLSWRRTLFDQVPGLAAVEALLASAPDLVFCIKDRQHRYLSANAAFLARVGAGEVEVVLGRTARDFFPAPLAKGYEQQDGLVFSTGRAMHDQLEMISKPDGSRGWFLAEKVPVHARDGTIVALAGVSRDLGADDVDRRLGPLAIAVDTLRRDFAQPLKITELAAASGLSLSRFERLMRSVLRTSPRQLLTRLRVEAAARELRATDTPLVDVAHGCGFCDQPTFCRQFRAQMGVSPGRYRRGKRAAPSPPGIPEGVPAFRRCRTRGWLESAWIPLVGHGGGDAPATSGARSG